MTPADSIDRRLETLRAVYAPSAMEAHALIRGAMIGLSWAQEAMRVEAAPVPAPERPAPPPAEAVPPAATPQANPPAALKTEAPFRPSKRWTDERRQVVREMYANWARPRDIADACNALPGPECTPKHCTDMAKFMNFPRSGLPPEAPTEATPAPAVMPPPPAPRPAPAVTPPPPAPRLAPAAATMAAPTGPNLADPRIAKANQLLDRGRAGMAVIQQSGITEAELRALNQHRGDQAEKARQERERAVLDMLSQQESPDVIARELKINPLEVERIRRSTRLAGRHNAA